MDLEKKADGILANLGPAMDAAWERKKPQTLTSFTASEEDAEAIAAAVRGPAAKRIADCPFPMTVCVGVAFLRQPVVRAEGEEPWYRDQWAARVTIDLSDSEPIVVEGK